MKLVLVALLAGACASGNPGSGEKTPTPTPPPSTPSLTDTDWSLVALGDETIPAQTGGRPITMRFGTDGRVAGSGGCNRFSGAWESGGDALRLGPLMTTKMACPAMNLERRFLEALGDASKARLSPGSLELLDAGGDVVARFAGGESPAPE